ncbi:GMC family oxidoreductase N-terminal domain-containing protein, partial [Candidatus Bathyarchaeota archaeon]|nr:GMC family oxidoreductase N-terminal domain-containing protein [Candidatus Bathyarchaeota archaeon]
MSLRFANGTPEYDDSVVGDGSGPLSVTFSHYVQAFGTWATKGLEEMGFPIIKGFLSGELLGQSYSTFTIDAETMTRDSSETSFLRKALGLPNYVVHHSTMAKKILFNEDNEATGVIVDTAGLEYVLSARKEVILSAGVFGSPQLLMVSGVGPADELSALDIPVIADRPGVGKNFQDHIYFGPSWRVNAPTISALADPAFAAQAALDYEEHAAGMYTNPITDVLAWEKVPEPLRSSMSNSTLDALATYPADWPELEYISLSAYLGFMENSRLGDPGDGGNYASLGIALCTPRSRGTVTIESTDTAVQPVIDPNFLGDKADAEVAVAGYKRAREFFDTDAMREFRLGEEAFPGKNITTDEQILDIIKRSYNTIYHGSCTCSMGKKEDDMAVVDTQGRVYGVEKLRIVDASIFPFLPPGHPMAT